MSLIDLLVFLSCITSGCPYRSPSPLPVPLVSPLLLPLRLSPLPPNSGLVYQYIK